MKYHLKFVWCSVFVSIDYILLIQYMPTSYVVGTVNIKLRKVDQLGHPLQIGVDRMEYTLHVGSLYRIDETKWGQPNKIRCLVESKWLGKNYSLFFTFLYIFCLASTH